MTINIRDNDQRASTTGPEPETPPGQDPDPMRSPATEVDAEEMHAEVASDDEIDVEVDAGDEMHAEVASRAQVPEPATQSETEPDAGSEDEPHVELNTGAYGRSEPEPEPEPEPETGSEGESHLELETGAYGRPEFGADMYDACAPGDDPVTEGAPEAAVAVGEPGRLDVEGVVDLRVAPAGVATEAAAVVEDASVYGERWNAIQTSFVDEPRQAVESADLLVTEAMEQLARALVSQRDSLQAQWRQDGHVDTEQLRVVFQGYRAFLFGLLPT